MTRRRYRKTEAQVFCLRFSSVENESRAIERHGLKFKIGDLVRPASSHNAHYGVGIVLGYSWCYTYDHRGTFVTNIRIRFAKGEKYWGLSTVVPIVEEKTEQ